MGVHSSGSNTRCGPSARTRPTYLPLRRPAALFARWLAECATAGAKRLPTHTGSDFVPTSGDGIITRVISRYAQLLLTLAILSAASVACSTHGNYRKDPAHAELLQKLHQCLAEVPIRGEKNVDFVSPCIRLDVAPLNGISRDHLVDALGRASFCIGHDGSGFPKSDDCPTDQNPQWSFYRLANPAVGGGGPELVCEANKKAYCETVEWRRSS